MKRIASLFLPFLTVGTMLPVTKITHDGPYVSYRDGQVFVKYIVDENGQKHLHEDSMALTERHKIRLTINSEEPGKTFEVKLKDQLVNEPAQFEHKGKQLVLSDIEGNLGAFRNLLLANGVIDLDFNWVFGTGHLVLIGDFVDRGEQVTEVLWLIYSLEEKAKAAGGYVHYILGNHEIMIMSGDLRYVNPKYKLSTELLKSKYEEIFDEHSELGRWLRTKNIMEKIGDNLFVHAGISDDILQLNIKVNNINKIARPFYADSLYKYPDKKLPVIFSDAGPFWFRGYYTKKIDGMQDVVDRALSKFGVKHIFTGHSIVADTISTWYNGRVINTDVQHSEGKSEAVLIEDGKYFRVNVSGKKHPLLN